MSSLPSEACEGAILASWRVKGIDYVNSMHIMLHCSIVACVHLSVWARDPTNQQAKKLVSLFAISLAKPVKARSQVQNLLPSWRSLGQSFRESSCLAKCLSLHVSVHCCLFFFFLYGPSKKLVFVPVASAMTGVHRDHPFLVSNIQWLEIQPLVSRGRLTSRDLPLTHTHTDNYNLIND